MIIKNINELIKIIHEGKYQFIGLDGTCYAGKTTLGKELSERLKIELISIDDFLTSNPIGEYPDYLYLDKLKSGIDRLLKTN